MNKAVVRIVVVLCFLAPQLALAVELPLFFEAMRTEELFPRGMEAWEKEDTSMGRDAISFHAKASKEASISVRYSKVTPETIETVFQEMGAEVERKISASAGEVVSAGDFFSVVRMRASARPSLFVLYATPDGSFCWEYTSWEEIVAHQQEFIDDVMLEVRRQQYAAALRHGNIIMGRWSRSVHAYAKLLLQKQKRDPLAKEVYMQLLQTDPANYEAHLEYVAVAGNQEEAVQHAHIVARDAEAANLLNAAAAVQHQVQPVLSSYPLFGVQEKGLQVVLLPLEPCNPWLLDDIARAYEKITSVPVVIRRLPFLWTPPAPSRSALRPHLERVAANLLGTGTAYGEWPVSKLKDELMKKAQEQGQQAVTSMGQLFQNMERWGDQWDADPIVAWLSQAIAPYFSKDPHTMVVAITEMDIYSGSSNFVFSLFGGDQDAPVSLLSYARMRAQFTGENQSRRRLTERAAKELVPASLKKLGIPRSTDPTCPYSYASGLQRLEEKTLTLAEPVKNALQNIKTNITSSSAHP